MITKPTVENLDYRLRYQFILADDFEFFFDREHRSRGPRNYFEDGDESTFLKKVVKMAKNGHRSKELL